MGLPSRDHSSGAGSSSADHKLTAHKDIRFSLAWPNPTWFLLCETRYSELTLTFQTSFPVLALQAKMLGVMRMARVRVQETLGMN